MKTKRLELCEALLRTAKMVLAASAIVPMMSSCGTTLKVSAVGYQAVRPSVLKTLQDPGAESAEIVMAYSFTTDGTLIGIIKNNTDEVMIIDQTKTLLVNTDGSSVSYFDPTVHTKSVTDMSSGTKGIGVNLGSVAGFFGLGGRIGGLLSGMNVSGSSTSGQSVTNTTYTADLPQVSIGPKGSAILSKKYQIMGIGKSNLSDLNKNFSFIEKDSSPLKFNVTVSYSIDGGETFKKITSNLFVSSQITRPVSNNKVVNEELRAIYTQKPDAINEPWWIIGVSNNISDNQCYQQGVIIDYK